MKPSSPRNAKRWTRYALRDGQFSQPYPLRVSLAAGEHHFEFTLTDGELNLGSISLTEFVPYPTYDDYLAAQTASDTSGFLQSLEAELPSFKNDTALRPASDRGLSVTPYDTYCLLMNTLGGESWVKSGSTAYYAIDVPEDGLYALTLRALQNTRSNFTVFRRITVNGEVPFEELNAVPFSSSTNWQDVTPGGVEDPYRVFLHEGVNMIGVEATNSPYEPAIETIQQALLDINSLALEINRLTGNQRDPFKEWDVANYIPDVEERLNAIAQRLTDDKSELLAIDPSGASAEILTYQMAIDNLHFLAEDPNKIPNYMSRFSEGTGSAAQQLGSLLPLLQNQPLALDRIDVHSPDTIPQTPAVPITTSVGEDIKRFIHSFQDNPYQQLGAEEGELEVWVNRPRQYVDLMQQMADSMFTPETGIRVKFSIMPDESKLILANAAGIQPDVALGVSTDKPYELAIRNALYDLRTFPNFNETIRNFAPGSLLGYIIDESVYAIPETQDFWVTFYRRDILDSLGLPVPQTWDEVIEILPELQRYGMNYNTPLSSGTGTRNYLFTAPYLFNYDAPLYIDGGFATGIGTEQAVEAIRFMADSFTLYGMPLTTANFFDGFRYGTLPIGISNMTDYIKLMTAAPELAGLWGIDLYPATVLPDGTENRYATGSAQTGIIFKDTDRPDDAWQFLQWWMSTETQTAFQEQLVLSYGNTYLWFSANQEAFANLDIPEEHRDVILEQRQWVQEPVRLPGSYMQERELSNVWSRIVFEGANPRAAIDRAITIINREITRKMEEFGYLQDGVRVREFHVPTIETVRGWMDGTDQN
ncbi:MAG: extracellular solute-binding protein [Anaerolineae bacterium]